MPICDECASRDVQRLERHGLVVEECGLCGHLQGDPAAVGRFLDIREAEELGIPLALLGMIQSLEAVPGLVVDRALSTLAGNQPPPAIFFRLRGDPLTVLDRLCRSLVLASRRTAWLWTLEVTHQGRLLFVLRPRLFVPPGELLQADQERFLEDLQILSKSLRRDLDLPWWDLD